VPGAKRGSPFEDAVTGRALAFTIPLALGAIVPVSAQEENSVAVGRQIALNVCAVCHVVMQDQAAPPTLKPPAPPFVEIAARPNVTKAFLRDFLTKPQGEARAMSAMPAFLMPSRQADEVIAYLMSLKGR
jgi:mono/diheme cytochrome c family protein